MVRSLHFKLVLIMMLLIISLMAVLGTFLLNSMANFYLDEFSDQMAGAFSDNVGFVNDLRTAAASEDGPYAHQRGCCLQTPETSASSRATANTTSWTARPPRTSSAPTTKAAAAST